MAELHVASRASQVVFLLSTAIPCSPSIPSMYQTCLFNVFYEDDFPLWVTSVLPTPFCPPLWGTESQMPAEGNTISYKLNVMSFCSYFKNTSFHTFTPTTYINLFPGPGSEKVCKRQKCELCYSEHSLEQVFFPVPLLVFFPAGVRPSWTEIYVPMKHCHVIWKDKVGEFSLLMMPSQFPQNIWYNWTVSAGSQSHFVVCVYRFRFVGNFWEDHVSKGVLCRRKQRGLCLLEEEGVRLCHPNSGSACGLAI